MLGELIREKEYYSVKMLGPIALMVREFLDFFIWIGGPQIGCWQQRSRVICGAEVKCKVKHNMRFAHPTPADGRVFKIIEAGTVVKVLSPSEMSDQEKKWLADNRKRDRSNQKRVAFRWEGRFRTALMNEDLVPHNFGGVITNRKW